MDHKPSWFCPSPFQLLGRQPAAVCRQWQLGMVKFLRQPVSEALGAFCTSSCYIDFRSVSIVKLTRFVLDCIYSRPSAKQAAIVGDLTVLWLLTLILLFAVDKAKMSDEREQPKARSY